MAGLSLQRFRGTLNDSQNMSAGEQASAEVSLLRTCQDVEWRRQPEERCVNDKAWKRVERLYIGIHGPSRCVLNSGGSVPSSCEE